MELATRLKCWTSFAETENEVVTITLDLAGSGVLPAATRLFFRNEVLESIQSPARPSLRQTATRIRTFVETGIRPETQGLFLTAGPGTWEAWELAVPLSNFLHVGRTPYLAPLLEALSKAPRVYVFRPEADHGLIQECEAGQWRDLERITKETLDVDTERARSGRAAVSRLAARRTGAGTGGGKRDRFEQSLQETRDSMLARAARHVGRLCLEAPAAAVFAFGDRRDFPAFQNHLPAPVRPLTRSLGALPSRNGTAVKDRVRAELSHLASDRTAKEILAFRERLTQGKLVALGPAGVFDHLATRRLARVYLRAKDPVRGMKCPACGRRYAGLKARCDFCPEETRPVSLTQEIVAHALAHPPLPITWVPASDPWLEPWGGMAALLSAKGIRTRRA